MGQYFKCYNATKREFFNPHALGLGLKLLEHCGPGGDQPTMADALYLLVTNSNGRGSGDAREHAVIGRWAGDSVVVQGDYAEKGDPGYIQESNRFEDISALVVEMCAEAFR